MATDRRYAFEADAKMVRAAASGDRSAAAYLVDTNAPRLLALAQRMLGGDEQAAEDVTQEAFLRLWRAAPGWRPQAMVGTWLHRVALNLCYDRLRRRREVLTPEPIEQIDDAPGAEEAMLRAELTGRVRVAVDSLPPRQRAAIALCHYEGMAGAEAADILDVSVEALESLLARARRTLRAVLVADAPAKVKGGGT